MVQDQARAQACGLDARKAAAFVVTGEAMATPVLYDYWRSSASYRVRIALNLKDIAYESWTVDLLGGAHKSPEHLARNPQGLVPVLEIDGLRLTQSLAIIEYLEERHPDPPMIGCDALERARVRELERIADLGVLLPVARIIHATNSPLGLPPVPQMAEHFRKVLPDALGFLNQRLSDGRSFVAALQFARFGDVEIDPALSNLARWDREYRERSGVRGVLSV